MFPSFGPKNIPINLHHVFFPINISCLRIMFPSISYRSHHFPILSHYFAHFPIFFPGFSHYFAHCPIFFPGKPWIFPGKPWIFPGLSRHFPAQVALILGQVRRGLPRPLCCLPRRSKKQQVLLEAAFENINRKVICIYIYIVYKYL